MSGTWTPRRTAAMLSAALVLTVVPAAAPFGAFGRAGLPPAAADDVNQRSKQLDQQMADLRESLEGAKGDFVEAAVALETSQSRLATARAALVTAQNTLAAATARDAELASQLEVAQAQQKRAERDLAAQTDAEETTRRTLGQIARSAYVGGQVTGLSIVLESRSAEQLSERLAVSGAALRAQNGAIDRLAVQQAEMRARTSKLTAVQAQVAELKRVSAEVVEQRRAAQAAAAAAESEVAALVVTQQQAVTTIQGKIDDERARLDQLAAEQSRLKAILAARARAAAEAARRRAAADRAKGRRSAPEPGSSSGVLSAPASGRISSGFGMRYHPILHISRLHAGIDFAVACGTPVRAAGDGEVISAGWAGGYGNRVVIDHGYVRGVGLATTYNHLTRIVRHGGSVSKGQLIGYSGTTGLSTGCHLHFETLANGEYTNPLGWM